MHHEEAMRLDGDASAARSRDYEADFGIATQMLGYVMADAYSHELVPEKLQEIADKLGVRNPYAEPQADCGAQACEKPCQTPEADQGE